MAGYIVNTNKNFTVPKHEKRVLIVGLTCIDIFNRCENFPREDEDANVLSQFWLVGGNAANTSRALAQHPNVNVHLYSGLSKRSENAFVLDDLRSYGVNIERCCIYDDQIFPTSCCIINNLNGSRTILHCNHNFPKLDFDKFSEIDINSYDLIHFEGRDLDIVSKMIDRILTRRTSNTHPLISAEMEKPKRLLEMEESFRGKIDILFVSKDIGKAKGFKNAMETVEYFSNKEFSSTSIVCPWGEEGAALAEKTDNRWECKHVPSFHIDQPVDTLGAGDIFIAGVLYSVVAKNKLEHCVEYGCYLAKEKCAQIGLKNLWEKSSTT